MEETYAQRELTRIADNLETYAQDLRDTPDRATLRAILDYILEGHHNGYFRRIEDRLREEDYYDCDRCETDFHTASERGGFECRKRIGNMLGGN